MVIPTELYPKLGKGTGRLRSQRIKGDHPE